jgi:hypothetical protein
MTVGRLMIVLLHRRSNTHSPIRVLIRTLTVLLLNRQPLLRPPVPLQVRLRTRRCRLSQLQSPNFSRGLVEDQCRTQRRTLTRTHHLPLLYVGRFTRHLPIPPQISHLEPGHNIPACYQPSVTILHLNNVESSEEARSRPRLPALIILQRFVDERTQPRAVRLIMTQLHLLRFGIIHVRLWVLRLALPSNTPEFPQHTSTRHILTRRPCRGDMVLDQ